VWLVVLAANALDLTTSAIPTLIDRAPPPPRSAVALVVQLALLVPLLWACRSLPRRIGRAWRESPLPWAARCVITTFVALQLLHVALRMENYPFSDVAMFSTLDRSAQGRLTAMDSYVLDDEHGFEMLRFLREGNPLFARHFDWDYKAAWLLRMYRGSPEVDALLTARLRREHRGAPSFRRLALDLRSGKVLSQVALR
jgi:hypothetical protein